MAADWRPQFDEVDLMAKTKRAASSGAKNGEPSLVDQVARAAEGALRDIQRRLPTDVQRQLEKSLGRGQKAIEVGLKRLQTGLDKTASKADVERLAKRVDALAAQVDRLLKGGAPNPRTSSHRAGGGAQPATARSSRARGRKAAEAPSPETPAEH
jgi:polyhydroxyalkanoate synthesis regulator phasin